MNKNAHETIMANLAKFMGWYMASTLFAAWFAFQFRVFDGVEIWKDQSVFGIFIAFQTFIATLFAGGLTYWRTEETKRANDMKEREETERQFINGIELLFKDQKSLLGGVTILESLAMSQPENFANRVVNAFLAVLRDHPGNALDQISGGKARLNQMELDEFYLDPNTGEIAPVSAEFQQLSNSIAELEQQEQNRWETALALGRIRFENADHYDENALRQKLRNIPRLLIKTGTLSLGKIDLSWLRIEFEAEYVSITACKLQNTFCSGISRSRIFVTDCDMQQVIIGTHDTNWNIQRSNLTHFRTTILNTSNIHINECNATGICFPANSPVIVSIKNSWFSGFPPTRDDDAHPLTMENVFDQIQMEPNGYNELGMQLYQLAN